MSVRHFGPESALHTSASLMTTPDKQSHWASLANVLGAKVPPEKTPPKPPAAAATAAAPPPPETPAPVAAPAPAAAAKPTKAKPAAKGKDNWGSVLGMLGLRAPEPETAPEPEVAPAAPVQERVAPIVERPAPVAERAAPPATPAARSNDWEKPFLAAQPLPKNLWELVGDTAPPPKSQTVEETFTEVGGNDLELGEDEDLGWEAPRPEPVARSRDEDRPRRDRGGEDEGGRRRRRRRRRRSEPGVEATDAPAARGGSADYDDEPVYRDEPDYDVEEVAPEVISHDDDEDFGPARTSEPAVDEEGRPRRRRRRRGRGRGRSSEREAAPAPAEPVGRSSYDDDLDEDEDDVVEAPRPARPAPASRSAAPRGGGSRSAGSGRMRGREAEVLEDDDHDDDHEDIDPTEHRGIPTWHEAMAIVVGANMDARAKNPQGSRGGRGRGGRGRGGRGRS